MVSCDDRGVVGRTGGPAPMAADPELFVAVGGRRGVDMIVDGLYDRLERDRELARLFRSRRSGERERLKEFFETIFGGEVRGVRDIGTQRRHVHRLISAAESARWLAHFAASMGEAGVAEGTQAAVMSMLRGPAARL
jgi:truncated hemoglobin YjbI